MEESDKEKLFKNLGEELDFLKQNIKTDDFNASKNASKSHTIQITLRKSILLRIVVPENYPLRLACSDDSFLSAKLHTLDVKNLKPARKHSIESFIARVNLELSDVIYSSPNICCVVKLFNQAHSSLVKNSDELLDESLAVLETQTKNAVFVVNSEINDSNSDQTKRKPVKEAVGANFDDSSSCKQKLKGADLIFQRIKWDSSIDKEQIIVGYLDRFLGVKEIQFSEFKGVHDDRDGIPLHRIRHFKINGTLVWDRDQRIDLMTGQDIAVFFAKQSVATLNPTNSKLEQSIETSKVDLIQQWPISQCVKNSWTEPQSVDRDAKPKFMGTFKLITYNIMSRNNFKKSLIDAMNQHEVEGIDLGLKNLELIDRMSKVNALLAESDPDFVLLQECEDYEEEKLRECDHVRKNYYICSTTRSSKGVLHSNCVILSKAKPVFFKVLQLSENSNKQALLAKFELRSSSLNKIEHMLLVNIHLTSDKSSNFQLKRKTQLETLHKYLVSEDKKLNSDLHELNSNYTFICGDFNFGDEADLENGLLKKLFFDKGFTDSCPNALTFDPTSNFAASLTSSKTYARRLDRILFRSAKCGVDNAFLVNTAPFKITPSVKPTYEPYLNVTSYTSSNKLPVLEANFQQNSVGYTDCMLNASDHYGLECTFKLKNSLHESSLVHKSSLAIVATSNFNELIQRIREKYDPQFDRWPPHFNLLYPFYENIELDCTEDEQESVVGEILHCLTQFEPFECELSEMETFDKNSVVFLKPEASVAAKMSSIYNALTHLFEDSSHSKWRSNFTPHMTIAQPVDKKRVARGSNWAKTQLDAIQAEFGQMRKEAGAYASFVVDSVYWIKRSETTPFEVMRVFPLGKTYPATILGLSPKDFTRENSILKFLHDKNMINSAQNNAEFDSLQQRILKEIFNSIKNSVKSQKIVQKSRLG